MSVFNLYAAYYDLLYRDKDYAGETDYLTALIREVAPSANSILELGCGSGGHALQFAERGFVVHGIDISAGMVDAAARRRAAARSEISRAVTFARGDVRSYRAGRSFDAVVSVFHVLSYQTTDADQDATFATARAHLAPGGVLVFDFWHGPAVLSDRPRHVTKRVTDERIDVSRETTPTMLVNENCVEVHFEIDVVSRGDGRTQRIVENHRMRYLFVPEIRQRLAATKFELISAYAWMSRLPLDDRSWYGCVVAQAR